MESMVENKKIYTCPMHPEVASDKQGSCPKCGISLLPTQQKTKGTHCHQWRSNPGDKFSKATKYSFHPIYTITLLSAYLSS